MQPDATAVRPALSAAGIDATVDTTSLGVVCIVVPADAVAALAALKGAEHGFVMLVDFLGTDTGEGIEVTYHLRSLTHDEDVYVKTLLDYEATLASVWESYPAALMPERETAELFGLRLSGHPNPARLLTVEGTAPLLRRDVCVRTPEEARDR